MVCSHLLHIGCSSTKAKANACFSCTGHWPFEALNAVHTEEVCSTLMWTFLPVCCSVLLCSSQMCLIGLFFFCSCLCTHRVSWGSPWCEVSYTYISSTGQWDGRSLSHTDWWTQMAQHFHDCRYCFRAVVHAHGSNNRWNIKELGRCKHAWRWWKQVCWRSSSIYCNICLQTFLTRKQRVVNWRVDIDDVKAWLLRSLVTNKDISEVLLCLNPGWAFMRLEWICLKHCHNHCFFFFLLLTTRHNNSLQSRSDKLGDFSQVYLFDKEGRNIRWCWQAHQNKLDY